MFEAKVPPGAEGGNKLGPQLVRKPATIARRVRPMVLMLPQNKLDLWKAWLRGVTELDLARMYGLRRIEVELVLYEMVTIAPPAPPQAALKEAA